MTQLRSLAFSVNGGLEASSAARTAVRAGDGAVPSSAREVAHPGNGFRHKPPCPSSDAVGGWGLVLVDRIADRWGITGRAADTRVWFELRAEE